MCFGIEEWFVVLKFFYFVLLFFIIVVKGEKVLVKFFLFLECDIVYLIVDVVSCFGDGLFWKVMEVNVEDSVLVW